MRYAGLSTDSASVCFCRSLRAATRSAPQFASGAALKAEICPKGCALESKARKGEPCVRVTIPNAEAVNGCRVFTYDVAAMCEGKTVVSGKGCAVKPSARYSTLQDLDAGRHTEIDMFSGALIRMGKELGIPTPYNEFAYHMIKALEEKNDGKFDYTGPNQEMTWAK